MDAMRFERVILEIANFAYGDSLELHLSPQFHPLDERKKVDEEGRFVGRLFEWCARVQRNIRRLIDSDSSLLYI